MEWDFGVYEGRQSTEIEVERLGWRLFRNGCPNGETFDSVGLRADRFIGHVRAEEGTVLLFGHRKVLRILAVRWIGFASIEGRCQFLATTSLSALGYDHNLAERVTHAWNCRGKATASAW